MLERRIQESRPGSNLLAEEDLPDRRLRREVRSDVDRVAERREVARFVGTDDTDECRAGVHTGSEWNPGAFGGSVARGAEQLLGCLDRELGVLPTGHERDEQPHDLVAHELLDDRIALDQNLARHLVEVVHEPGEIECRYLSGELARAANVGEQHRQLDLPPTDFLVRGRTGAGLRMGLETPEAAPADLRVLLPRGVPEPPEDQGPRSSEWRLAELAPGTGRDEPERAGIAQVWVRAPEEVVPLLLRRCVLGHGGEQPSVTRSASARVGRSRRDGRPSRVGRPVGRG